MDGPVIRSNRSPPVVTHTNFGPESGPLSLSNAWRIAVEIRLHVQ